MGDWKLLELESVLKETINNLSYAEELTLEFDGWLDMDALRGVLQQARDYIRDAMTDSIKNAINEKRAKLNSQATTRENIVPRQF